MLKFRKRELKLGIAEELEHTKNRNIAERLAKDHLVEYPKWYSEMKRAKKKFTKRKRRGKK